VDDRQYIINGYTFEIIYFITKCINFIGSKQQQYEENPSAIVYGKPIFHPDYNTPEGFRTDEEMKDDDWKKLRQMDMLSKGIDNSNKAYTEGGLVFLPKKGKLTR